MPHYSIYFLSEQDAVKGGVSGEYPSDEAAMEAAREHLPSGLVAEITTPAGKQLIVGADEPGEVIAPEACARPDAVAENPHHGPLGLSEEPA